MIILIFSILSLIIIYTTNDKKKLIILLWILLLIFWTFAIYSVSTYESFSLTKKLISIWALQWEPYNNFYFKRHIRNIIVALIVWIVAYKIKFSFFKNQKNSLIIFILIFLFQLAVFLPEPIWSTFNWARWRIKIWWIFTLQPSEFFKLWYVIFLSYRLNKKKEFIKEPSFLIMFIIINIIVLFVFFLIPDFWTVLILAIVWLIMARYAWVKFKYVLWLFILWVIWWWITLSIFWSFSTKFKYIQKRFTYFINSDVDPEKKQIWRQNEQALMAIWWWWFFWQWYQQWSIKLWSLPEAQSDFIFSAYSEEIWFVWDMILLSLYFLLAYTFLINLHKIRDPFVKQIWIWIISLIIIQMFINIWVNLKIMPNTWLTLPWISFWWTALMVNVIEIIFLYKILKEWNV